MVRMLLLGFVVVLATLGGSYAAMQFPQGGSADEGAPAEKSEIVKVDPVSVPVVRDGKIQGYVIGRLAFAATGSEIRQDKDALLLYVNESIFRSIHEEEKLDFTALKAIDVEGLIGRIVAKANARIGRPAIRQVFVENLSFLAHDAVRCQPTK